jgi:uncharacterized protein
MSMLVMSKAEREAFLAETRVAVVSIADGRRGPLSVPVWYRYTPGDAVVFLTGAKSRKAAAIREAGRVSLCVQTETAPYQYVTVEGPAVLAGEPDPERDVREMAIRYLGTEMGEMYLQMTAPDHLPGMNVVVRVTPARWLSADFRKMMPA